MTDSRETPGTGPSASTETAPATPDPADAGATGGARAETPPAEATAEEAPRVRRSLFRRRRPAEAGPPDQPTGAIPVAPPVPAEQPPDQPTGVIAVPEDPAPAAAPTGGARLRRERRRLMREREDLVFHLGGLAFELHRRGLLTEDVARRRAGLVAEIDETVRRIDAQLEGLQAARAARRRGAPAAPAVAETGCCLVCRAHFYADARFCMQCGSSLAPPPPEAPPAPAPGETGILPTPGTP